MTPSALSGNSSHCAGRRSAIKWIDSLAASRTSFIAVRTGLAATSAIDTYCTGGQWSHRGRLERATGGCYFSEWLG